jgi:hypothetical protein
VTGSTFHRKGPIEFAIRWRRQLTRINLEVGET